MVVRLYSKELSDKLVDMFQEMKAIVDGLEGPDTKFFYVGIPLRSDWGIPRDQEGKREMDKLHKNRAAVNSYVRGIHQLTYVPTSGIKGSIKHYFIEQKAPLAKFSPLGCFALARAVLRELARRFDWAISDPPQDVFTSDSGKARGRGAEAGRSGGSRERGGSGSRSRERGGSAHTSHSSHGRSSYRERERGGSAHTSQSSHGSSSYYDSRSSRREDGRREERRSSPGRSGRSSSATRGSAGEEGRTFSASEVRNLVEAARKAERRREEEYHRGQGPYQGAPQGQGHWYSQPPPPPPSGQAYQPPPPPHAQQGYHYDYNYQGYQGYPGYQGGPGY